MQAPEGGPVVYVNGVATPAIQGDGVLRVENVGPGCHILALVPGPVTPVGPPNICN